MADVYFPISGLVSVSGRAGPSRWVEVWLIGSEGMVGIPAVLGTKEAPGLRRVMQIGGAAWRIAPDMLSRAMDISPALRRRLLRYIDVVLLQTAQSSICNATHELRERLSRWLLVAHDALCTDEIALTHQLLARLLGVTRPSVTQCLHVLEEHGAIETRRGRIVISDKQRLEALSCHCHRIIRSHAQAALQPGDGTGPS